MRKVKLILPMLLSAMFLSSFQSFAAAYTTEVTNNISLGDVNISINEYEHEDNGNEVAYKDNKVVWPGEKVDKIIRIHNNANAVWLRAKLEYTDCGDFKGLSDENVELASDNWIKRGDYYYCTVPVEAKKAVDFVKAVNIPSEWNETRSDSEFSIYTTVDAVQEANFTPDFSSDDPWFGTVIEECVHSKPNITTAINNQAFQVVYENGADGLVKVGDDFFSNWASLMPGDVVSDSVAIGNHYSHQMAILFRTETIADDTLLNKVHMTIKNGDTVLYDGSMNGEITKEIRLGFIKQNETMNLNYTVSIPAELKNEYALASTKTKWIFSCFDSSVRNSSGRGSSSNGTTMSSGETSTVTPTPGPTPEPTPSGNTPTPTTIPGKITEITRKIPKLGDSNIPQVIFGISAVSLFLAGALWRPRKKNGKEAGKDE